LQAVADIQRGPRRDLLRPQHAGRRIIRAASETAAWVIRGGAAETLAALDRAAG